MTRTPFTPAERLYMDANNPKIFGHPKSYSQIADELNRLFASDNHLCRTGGSVRRYYEEQDKPNVDAIRHVRIPVAVSRALTNTDITRILVSHCGKIGKKA